MILSSLRKIALALSIVISLLVSPFVAPLSAHAEDDCPLPGEGTEVNPWQVDSQADFQVVGQASCSLAGHYLQTGHLTGPEALDDFANDNVNELFTGVYDGDHYTIDVNHTITSSTFALFTAVGRGGQLKKIRLTGTIAANAPNASSLVGTVRSGGLVSEVGSSVNISTTQNDVQIGGLAWRLDEGGRIQYSKYSGTISWQPAGTAGWSEIGGLVGYMDLRSNGESDPDYGPWAEIRDSYTTGAIEFPSGAASRAIVGGILGQTTTLAKAIRIVRSYSAMAISSGATVGGLVGQRGNLNADQVVSSFWLASATVTKAVGNATPTFYFYEDYLTTPDLLPVAPGVEATELATLTTFTTQESLAGSGNPGGTEIEEDDSDGTGTPSLPDYRWAIEQGDVSVFIPSSYNTYGRSGSEPAVVLPPELTDRLLFTSPLSPQTYRTRGTNAETATTYPLFGRVWEMCSGVNSGFPVLVWEERSCSGDGPGGSSGGESGSGPGSGDNDLSESVGASSQLPTLAATGASLGPAALGGVASLALVVLGASLLLQRRRFNSDR